MHSRRSVLRALGVGTVFGVSGCLAEMAASGEGLDGAERPITDGFGRTVTVPGTVEAVVGVGPGALRQVAYLDATDRVVGVEEGNETIRSTPYNLAYPGLREKPVIGSAGPNAGGNSEEILAADPDVIFYYGEPSRAETLHAQTETPVIGLDIVDFVDRAARQTMFDTWRLVGDVLGTEARAEALIDCVGETISDLQVRADGIPADERNSAYVGAINYKGSHGIATTRARFGPFRWTGVDNIARGIDTDSSSVQVSTEQLLSWDPQTLFLSTSNQQQARADVSSNPEYTSIRAIETDRTYSILPHASYHHNYGSMLANAYFVGKTVYPDQFADVEIGSKTDEIFEAMLGRGLADELRDTHDPFQRVDLA